MVITWPFGRLADITPSGASRSALVVINIPNVSVAHCCLLPVVVCTAKSSSVMVLVRITNHVCLAVSKSDSDLKHPVLSVCVHRDLKSPPETERIGWMVKWENAWSLCQRIATLIYIQIHSKPDLRTNTAFPRYSRKSAHVMTIYVIWRIVTLAHVCT